VSFEKGPRPICQLRVPIATAVVKKVPTATNDLTLNLAIPHSPWPLVHPLLNLVPKPTRKPDIANPG
jgi:hypothetical protein